MGTSNGKLLEGRCLSPTRAAVRWRTQPTGSEQPQIDELAPERLRHGGEVSGGAAEIARGILVRQVAPALERAAGPRLDRDHDRLEREMAAADAVAVGERPDRHQPLA